MARERLELGLCRDEGRDDDDERLGRSRARVAVVGNAVNVEDDVVDDAKIVKREGAH